MLNAAALDLSNLYLLIPIEKYYVLFVPAHGKRSGDKNIFVQKLLSAILREPTEPKLLEYPNIRRSLNSNQWIPNGIDIYDKGSRTR